MKWVTREKTRVDRIACPWLITRFIDKSRSSSSCPRAKCWWLRSKKNAVPYDVPGVELAKLPHRVHLKAFILH